MKLVPIDASTLEVMWPELAPWVDRALEDYPHLDADYIRKAIAERDMSAWALVEAGSIVGAVVAEVINYPRLKAARIVTASTGDGRREEWMPFLRQIEAWGRSYGCTLMQYFGREGFARFIPGAKRRNVVEWSV